MDLKPNGLDYEFKTELVYKDELAELVEDPFLVTNNNSEIIIDIILANSEIDFMRYILYTIPVALIVLFVELIRIFRRKKNV